MDMAQNQGQGATNFAADWNSGATDKAVNSGGQMPPEGQEDTGPQVRVLGQIVSKKNFNNDGSVELIDGKFTGMPPTASIKVTANSAPFGVANRHRVNVEVNIQVFVVPPTDKESNTAQNKEADTVPHTLFTLDLVYTGIFDVTNVPSEEVLKQILLIYCPSLMFPFVRCVVAETTRDSGCPVLMLEPIDFAAIYRKNAAGKQ